MAPSFWLPDPPSQGGIAITRLTLYTDPYRALRFGLTNGRREEIWDGASMDGLPMRGEMEKQKREQGREMVRYMHLLVIWNYASRSVFHEGAQGTKEGESISDTLSSIEQHHMVLQRPLTQRLLPPPNSLSSATPTYSPSRPPSITSSSYIYPPPPCPPLPYTPPHSPPPSTPCQPPC